MQRLTKGRRHCDSGSTLLSVIVLMLVLSVIALATAAVTVSTTHSLVRTRTNAEARAAADAGLAALVAHARRTNDFCDISLPDPGPSVSGPRYEATSNPGNDPAGGCDGTKVTFESTGFAADGSQAITVAEYQIIANTAPPTAGGPGLFYTHDMKTRMNSYVFDHVNSEVGVDEFAGAAGVYATKGSLACGTGSVIPGDVYVESGSMQFDSGTSCLVEGNAYVGGTVNMYGGAILGSLIAPSTANQTISGTVGTPGGSEGNVFLGGTLTLNNGTVHGSVNAAGTGSSTLGSGTIHGNFIYKGSYGIWGTPATTIVKGAIVKNAALAAPTLPEIPDWQDVTFTPTNPTTPPKAWVDEGYKLTTVTGAACDTWSGGKTEVTSVAGSLTSRMIFDIRACSEGFSTNHGDAKKEVKINRDIAIIANSWYLSGTKFKSADGQPHTIFLITPDGNPGTAGPQCNWPAQDSQQGNGSTVDPKIAIYIYTPCDMWMNDSSSTFRGQIYSGSLTFGGGVKVAFAPRNIPGYDFGKDVDPWPGGGGGAGALLLGELQSQRDVS